MLYMIVTVHCVVKEDLNDGIATGIDDCRLKGVALLGITGSLTLIQAGSENFEDVNAAGSFVSPAHRTCRSARAAQTLQLQLRMQYH